MDAIHATQVRKSSSGREIKQRIFDQSGIPVEQQALKFAGKEFGDDTRVEECGSMPVRGHRLSPLVHLFYSPICLPAC